MEVGPVKIVIDVGSARYGEHHSIERLLDEFQPDVLYAFDPSWETEMYEPREHDTAYVIAAQTAAWTHEGTVPFKRDGLTGFISSLKNAEDVPCIDLAEFIRKQPEAAEIILKVDAEGAEYDLLDHLMEKGVDERLSLAWVEFHKFGCSDPKAARARIEQSIRCPLDEWPW